MAFSGSVSTTMQARGGATDVVATPTKFGSQVLGSHHLSYICTTVGISLKPTAPSKVEKELQWPPLHLPVLLRVCLAIQGRRIEWAWLQWKYSVSVIITV